MAAVTFFTSFSAVVFIAVCYAVEWYQSELFVVAGIAGFISNLYGFFHFRTLMSLKAAVDKYSKNNLKFAAENQSLNVEVNRFSQAKTELSETQKRIRESVKRQEVSLVKFRQLNNNLKATGGKNLDLIKDLHEMSLKMERQWKEQLIKKERKILNVCFERFGWVGGNDGLSRQQFTEFKMTLPMEYQLRITKAGDWQSIAGDDGILQLDEFTEFLDKFAEDVVGEKRERMNSEADPNTIATMNSEAP